MKILTALVLALFFIASTAAAQTENRTIAWEKDFSKALAAARLKGQPVMIYFTAGDCQTCREMDAQYWAVETVAAAVKPFIAVKLNVDTEKALAAKFSVNETPFVAFTDPLGNLISFRRGFDKDTPRRLNVALKDVTKDFSSLEKAYQTVERKKDDGGALLEIADFYRTTGNLYLSSEFYKRALKTQDVRTDAAKKERSVFALGINAAGYRDYRGAVDNLSDYLKNYPQGTFRETALTLLIVSSANLNEFAKSDDYLAQLKAEFPASKNIAVAVKAVDNAKTKRHR